MSVKVEFHEPDTPDVVVATATWDGSSVTVETPDDDVRARVQRVFRPTPVVVNDPAYRRQGTDGEVLVQPGTLEWLRAAAWTRARPETGLAARFVPGIREGGYDPAAQYRTFEEALERLTSGG